MNIEIVVYVIQIIVLLVCIYMTWRVRFALSGLARGLIALFILLIVRRVDDAFGVLSAAETVILSTAVVIVVADDLYYLYKMRETLQVSHLMRKQREAKLEAARKRSEELAGKSWDIN